MYFASPAESNPGSDLLSHAGARAVPSALEGLTTVFGMGTGVAPPESPPGKLSAETLPSDLRTISHGSCVRIPALD